MHSHRVRDYLTPSSLPRPASQRTSWAGFVGCPSCLLPGVSASQWVARQWLYQAAFEEAQAVVRPSLPERDLLGVWN